MDYYANAQGWHKSAIILINNGMYQQAIYHLALATELYLKSRLHKVPHDVDLETSHNIKRIFKTIASIYGNDKTITHAVKMVGKYFNESRYPSSPAVVFDKDLADKLIEYVTAVKNYIDTQCMATTNE